VDNHTKKRRKEKKYKRKLKMLGQITTVLGLPLVSIGTNIALKSSVVVKKIIARNVKNR
jgi:hypothetical protein